MSRVTSLAVVLLCAMLAASLRGGCAASASPVPEVAGTYELDREAVKAAMQAEIELIEDEEERWDALTIMGTIDMMSITLTLNQDGTANGEMTMFDEAHPASGTWTLDGGTLTVIVAPEGDEAATMIGTVDGDTIRLSVEDEDEDMPFDLVFVRRDA